MYSREGGHPYAAGFLVVNEFNEVVSLVPTRSGKESFSEVRPCLEALQQRSEHHGAQGWCLHICAAVCSWLFWLHSWQHPALPVHMYGAQAAPNTRATPLLLPLPL